MDGQIGLFEYMPQLIPSRKLPTLTEITEEEAVRIVGERLGVAFARNERLGVYRAKYGKLLLSLSYGHYAPGIRGGRLHLGASWDKPKEGGSSACDSLELAIEFLEGIIRREKDGWKIISADRRR